MAGFVEYLWQIITMVILLLLSAVMSGSETAYFNISRRESASLKQSPNRWHKLAMKVLRKPRRLLTSLLFGNMVVNVLFFALASVLSLNVADRIGSGAGALSAVVCFLCLLLLGEMLPKSFAYSNSRRFAISVSPVCYVLTRILWPVLRVFEFFVVLPITRLLVGSVTTVKSTELVTVNQFKELIEISRQQGLISSDENQLLSEVIELGLLKVRHVMCPRVDMVACEVGEDPERVIALMGKGNLSKIPVYLKNIDKIVGVVHQRDLLINRGCAVERLIKPVSFVPEHKTVESLLEFFRENRSDTAIAVDEYGGIAGSVSLTNIVEELIGPIEPVEEGDAIEQIGDLEYRLAGNLAIHEWAAAFGIDPGQSRFSTIGGLATALLGRIPKAGDVAHLKNLKLTVETVRKRRIVSLILSLENDRQER